MQWHLLKNKKALVTPLKGSKLILLFCIFLHSTCLLISNNVPNPVDTIKLFTVVLIFEET